MGDRANVYVKETATTGVYLYTHWDGHELPEIVRGALASDVAQRRWQDGPYLARILFCRLVRSDVDGETGYGISSHLCDNEHPIIVVDPSSQKIGFAFEPTDEHPIPEPTTWQSFTSYCEKKTAKWPKRNGD